MRQLEFVLRPDADRNNLISRCAPVIEKTFSLLTAGLCVFTIILWEEMKWRTHRTHRKNALHTGHSIWRHTVVQQVFPTWHDRLYVRGQWVSTATVDITKLLWSQKSRLKGHFVCFGTLLGEVCMCGVDFLWVLWFPPQSYIIGYMTGNEPVCWSCDSLCVCRQATDSRSRSRLNAKAKFHCTLVRMTSMVQVYSSLFYNRQGCR